MAQNGPRTIYQVLRDAAVRYGPALALSQPYTENGQRKQYSCTWEGYLKAAEEIAAGLHTLGVAKGDTVALDSETRLEFYLADMGTLALGAIAAALYPSYPAPDLVRNICTTKADVVFVENPKTLAALREAPVRHWVLLTGTAEGALTLDELRAKGRLAMERDAGLLEALTSAVSPADPAVLYQTSGATGEPKMALVSHHSIVANIEMGPHVLPLTPQDVTVAFLPSAHIAQRLVIEFLPVPSGMPVTFAESLLKLPQDIKAVRPTILLAPPRMWERIHATVCTEVRKRPAAIRKAFYGALGLGLAAARYRRQGKPVPARISIPLKAADAVFFRKIRSRFGGRLRVAASGAAPLGKELAEFYEAIGMPLVEGYGLTEGGVTALNPLSDPRPGSIGKPLPGVEVRIAEDGELLLKSPCNFMGYHNDPQATAEVLRDGWLHTGDVAHIDADGYLYVTGRKKEMIVSSTGKKIFPARVESLFKVEPLVSQVLLLGDGLPFVAALFTLNPTAAEALDGMDDWRGRAAAPELSAAPPVVDEVRKAVARVNRQLAPFEQIRRYRLLDRDFSIEAGELTATMKIRRKRVIENFREQIEELYAGKEHA